MSIKTIYEIRTDSFTIRMADNTTEEDIFNAYFDGYRSADPELVSRHDTIEEARAAFEAVKKNTHSGDNGWCEVAFIQEVTIEIDEDGDEEEIDWGDIWDSYAEPIYATWTDEFEDENDPDDYSDVDAAYVENAIYYPSDEKLNRLIRALRMGIVEAEEDGCNSWIIEVDGIKYEIVCPERSYESILVLCGSKAGYYDAKPCGPDWYEHCKGTYYHIWEDKGSGYEENYTWYALCQGDWDTDHGTGTFDWSIAKKSVLESEGFFDRFVGVDPEDDFCRSEWIAAEEEEEPADLNKTPCAYSKAYEDNNGSLFLCLYDRDDTCFAIFGNWEYGERGYLAEAMRELIEYPLDARNWEGNVYERLMDEGYVYPDGSTPTFEDIVNDITDLQLIAETMDGHLDIWEPERIGYAGIRALGLEEEDE